MPPPQHYGIQWLAEWFLFLGIEFQYWMPLALAIVVLDVIYLWIRKSHKKPD